MREVSRTRRQRRPAVERREQVVAAARVEFMAHGYDGVTVRDIAKAADVNEAILYRFFDSKEALFEEAVAGLIADAVTSALTPAKGDRGVRMVSEAWVRDMLTAMREVAPLLMTVLAEPARARRFFQQRLEPEFDRLAQVIERNFAEWDHRDFDIPLAMRATTGMCLFMALDGHYGSAQAPAPAAIAPELFSLFWDGLRARPRDTHDRDCPPITPSTA